MEDELLNAISQCKTLTEMNMKSNLYAMPDTFFKWELERMIDDINRDSIQSGKNEVIILEEVDIKKEDKNLSSHNPPLGVIGTIGTGLWVLGLPTIQKRFVTPGAADGTSVASKYLSKLFPGKFPFGIKMYGTTVSGRIIGRLVPKVGVALMVIDAIRIYEDFRETVPYYDYELERVRQKRGHRIWGDEHRPGDNESY